MTIKRYYFIIIMFALSLFVWTEPIRGNSLTIEDLQAAIDNAVKTRASTVSEIDISGYSSVKFTSTLYIRNGQSIKFINGTLAAADTYDGPIVTVQAGGYLELPSSVTMTGNYSLTHSKGLVNVTCGELKITGASLEVGTIVSSRGVVVSSPSDDSSISSYSKIYMESGHIYGSIGLNNKYDYLYLSGGSASFITTQEQNVNIILTSNFSSAVGFASYTTRMAYLNILFQIHNSITIRNGQASVYEGDIIAKGYDGYKLTEDDLKKVIFSPSESEGEWETYLEDNCIKVRKATSFDLQAELNKVAAAGTYTYEKPATITIPERGIIITKWISVPEKCHALLTGGPIRIELQSEHCAFYLNGSIHLKDISIGCNKNGYSGFDDYFMGNGKLKVDYNTTYINNNIENPTGLFYQLEGAELEYLTEEVFKSSKHMVVSWDESIIKMYGSAECQDIAIDAPKSTVKVLWGTVASAGDYVIRCKDITVTETGTTIKSLREDASSVVLIEAETARYITGEYIGEGSRIVVKKEAETYGHVALPTLKLETDATVKAIDRLQYPITLEGDWQNFTIGKGIMYCNVADTALVTIEKPYPSGINPLYYNLEGAFLFADLQWVIDHPLDNTGDDDEPVEVSVGCDGVNLTDDILFQRLQAAIDGVAYEDECEEEDDIKKLVLIPHCNCDRHPVFPAIKVWHLNGNTTIAKGACITLRNLYFDGLGGTKRIYVEGTLIIDVYVYFTRFNDYAIHIRPGGKVIWRGGWTETIEKVIYNEGGTITIEGGYIYDGGNGGNVIVNIDGTINIQNDSDGVPTYVHGTIVNGDNGHKSGTINIYEGSYEGTITNYGKIVIDGADINGLGDYGIRNYGECYFHGGTSTGKDNVGIWSYTDFHLCGCANVGDIHLRGGSTIYVTERLTVKIRIHIFIDGTISNGAIIAVGTGGYVLSEEDLKLIELILPSGYEWEYDKSKNAIIIKSSTGINGVEMDSDALPSDIYTLKGVKVGNTADKKNIPNGIYVVDGKKTVLQ